MEYIFYILIVLILLIYFIYPFVLWILSLFSKPTRTVLKPDAVFRVTLIITARNEEKVIEQKLRNSLAIQYPKLFFDILLVSDHSTDRTVEIARSFSDSRINILNLEKRHGKTDAQNIAAKYAKGEILVFSDANAMYESEAIQHLIKHFHDQTVGCVSGELCYLNQDVSEAGKKEGLYWKYEKWIKNLENEAGLILGANGSIYAVRKSDYVFLDLKDISDFIEPLEIAARGKKVVFETNAKSYETSSDHFKQEFKRKRRIISRSLYSMFKHRWILNIFKRPLITFELMFHKILRWISPIFIFCIFIVNGFLLNSLIFCIFFIGQSLFYMFALIGLLFQNRKYLPAIFSIPAYVVMVGYASILGFLDFLRKKHAVVWEPDRA